MSVCMEGEIKTNADFNAEDYVYVFEYLSSQGFIKCKIIHCII
jgi:hypothetical protein